MEKINLICFPYAGASVYSYISLMKAFPAFINPIPIELPGRGKRIADCLITEMAPAIDECFKQIEVFMHKPYAFYGHSMGALFAFLLSRRIFSNDKLPKPLHLFLSGAGSPGHRKKGVIRHLLPRDQFIQEIKNMGGTPHAIFEDEGLLNFYEPILRADFSIIENYKYQKEKKLPVPISVFIGTNDEEAKENATLWKEETSNEFSLLEFTGNHFFIFEHLEEMTKTIGGILKVYIK
jgi:surfactin synthase thioesterase subunit